MQRPPPSRAGISGFRLPGDRVRHVESGILLEPMVMDFDVWFAELDRLADLPFMKKGREQSPMPAGPVVCVAAVFD